MACSFKLIKDILQPSKPISQKMVEDNRVTLLRIVENADIGCVEGAFSNYIDSRYNSRITMILN